MDTIRNFAPFARSPLSGEKSGQAIGVKYGIVRLSVVEAKQNEIF